MRRCQDKSLTPEPHLPITISTFGDLAARGYALTLACLPCRRNMDADLAALPAGLDYTRAHLVCRQCRRPLEKTVRPPTRLTGYGAPASDERRIQSRGA